MSASAQLNLEKIQQLLATATNPKQKAMYEALLQKAGANQATSAQTSSKPSQKPVRESPLSVERDSPKKSISDSKTSSVTKTSTDISFEEQTSENTPPSKTKPLVESKKKSPSQQKKAASPDSLPTEEQPPLSQAQGESEDQPQPQAEALTSAFFQAVGVIQGEVNINEKEQLSVTFNQKTYKLFYVKEKRAAYTGLKKEIENTGNSHYKLVVYPRVIHFPRQNQPHEISFQLVAFVKEDLTHSLSQKINEFEFQLSGLWQFIPPCRLPCISVFRNYSPPLLDYLKNTEINQKVKTFKTNHLPVIWQDAPVRPFRFNPKQDPEQQGHPSFVRIKARFLPQKNLFTFVEQLAEPSEITPKFLKVSKEDKMKAQQEKRKAANSAEAKENKPPKKSPQQNKRKKKRKKLPAMAQSDKPSESAKPL